MTPQPDVPTAVPVNIEKESFCATPFGCLEHRYMWYIPLLYVYVQQYIRPAEAIENRKYLVLRMIVVLVYRLSLKVNRIMDGIRGERDDFHVSPPF